MKKIYSLFFELIRVSVGQLDCLSRGPEPEEWQTLYELSKQHHVEGISYLGVTKLFEYGLRAPQDISLDWMSESEILREQNEAAERPSELAVCYGNETRDLRQRADDEVKYVSQFQIKYVYQQYLHKKLDMRMLLDYYHVLRLSNGKYETLKSGGLLSSLGVRRFARGVMWMLQETLSLDKKYMPYKPLEKEGRFLLRDMMHETTKLQRIVHLLITYPLGLLFH